MKAHSEGLKRVCAIRRVDYGWSKGPEQLTLVRGSAGTACEGSSDHPLMESRRDRRYNAAAPVDALDPEDQLAKPHALGRERLEINPQ